jgi:hypothetical protein
VRPFRSAGSVACLEERRVPVYLVVVDGLWEGRRFLDFLANVPRLRGVTDVLGPFEAPGDDALLPAFVEECRGRIVERQRALRQARARG